MEHELFRFYSIDQSQNSKNRDVSVYVPATFILNSLLLACGELMA
jgi:hypothetical protein